MFFLVESQYEGPDWPNHVNAHWLTIQRETPRDQEGAAVDIGDLGRIGNDRAYAHGAFAALDEARESLVVIAGNAGYREEDRKFLGDARRGVIERYLVGRRPRLGKFESAEFADAITDQIAADTPDAEIADMVDATVTAADLSGYDGIDVESVRRYLTQFRDDQREAAAAPV